MESAYITQTGKYIEYIKLHLISLEQDIEGIASEMELIDPSSKAYTDLDFEYNHLSGQALLARHLLSVAIDILRPDMEVSNVLN
jgi:hypothetical protein